MIAMGEVCDCFFEARGLVAPFDAFLMIDVGDLLWTFCM